MLGTISEPVELDKGKHLSVFPDQVDPTADRLGLRVLVINSGVFRQPIEYLYSTTQHKYNHRGRR